MSTTATNDDPLNSVRLAVLSAAVDSDPGTAFDIVSDLLSNGMPFETILFGVLGGLEREIGRRWHAGDLTIADEHAATATVETLVSLLGGSLSSEPDAPLVVAVTAEGDHHSLPARMITAHLTFLGWRSKFLGASVPGADMIDFLEMERPVAVVVSCALSSHLVGARKTVAAAHRAGVPVLVGGLGFGSDSTRAEAIGADAWATDPAAVDDVIANWSPDIVAAEQRAARADTVGAPLLRHRVEIIGGAHAEMVRLLGGGTDLSVVTEDIKLFLNGVTSAVMVDDPSILSEITSWHTGRRTGHPTQVSADAIRDALRSGLAGLSDPAVAVLAEGHLT